MSSALQGGSSATGYQWKSPCANFWVEICFQFSLQVEMLGRMVTLFIRLKNCQPVFLKLPKIPFFFFTIPPAVYEVPMSPHPHQHLLLSVFLILTILVDVNRYLLVVLICITLVVDHVECLFMCLLTICMSSLERGQFKSNAHWHFF